MFSTFQRLTQLVILEAASPAFSVYSRVEHLQQIPIADAGLTNGGYPMVQLVHVFGLE